MGMLRRGYVAAIAISLYILPIPQSAASQCEPGSFKGELNWKPLPDDPRNVRLGSDFTFFDGTCREWLAPKGHVVNGTSIPSILWTLTGRTPYIGRHRRASAIHDVYYDLKTRPAHETHKAFYEALIADNVGKIEARIMYLAVTAYAPRWLIDKSFVCPPRYRCANDLKRHYKELLVTPEIDSAAIEEAARKVESANLSLEQVRALGDDLFFRAKHFQQVGVMENEISDQPIKIDRTADIDMPVEYLLRQQQEDGDSAFRNLHRNN
jgi:hypothetical protein